MNKVEKVYMRNIINSQGSFAIEADVKLEDEIYGRASAPLAILPGRRENITTKNVSGNIPDNYKEFIKQFCGKYYNQKTWDEALEAYMGKLGTDITLALSLAFARASAKANRLRLIEYIRDSGNIIEVNKNITFMIPIFSGGIHDISQGGSMQQIMLSISELSFFDALNMILLFYSELEVYLQKTNKFKGYASSSGFLINHLEIEEEFEILSKTIDNSGIKQHLSIAIDVAAEHLKEGKLYRFYNKLYTADELERKLLNYVKNYPIKYLEDPFDFVDIENWKTLHYMLKDKVEIFSDDLSATQIQYLDEKNSDGVIVKMKQVGTLSSTLNLINKVKELQLKTCVSHRSIETEDTFLCDLGVAIGTDYMKIGGPRRGDRVEKYNRLIRIFDSVDYA